MSYEENLKRLEEITEKMENPNLTMRDGVCLYEEGVKIVKECYEELNSVKGKINVIRKDLDAYREESLD